ncbi:MAG: N-acetyl-gamma-glutamyl-phosphate reductase [Candidatus Aerophobetes bacterium ADurb.Bin490]|nr:MAG: N-acetyl-gamma-glutamyl-phosphate reductase [Candidatus Aerophobetes bacterium ADurb.Bin490]
MIAAERGILSNIYIKTKKKVDPADAKKVYQDFYKNEPFIRVVDSVSLHQVQKNNFCDIAVSGVKEMNILLVSTVLDNMVKGASGQAVQNMNLMFGLNEQEGLK